MFFPLHKHKVRGRILHVISNSTSEKPSFYLGPTIPVEKTTTLYIRKKFPSNLKRYPTKVNPLLYYP